MNDHHHYNYVDEDSSHVAKLLMLSYVVISLIMCGGTVFGFTPLKEILLNEGTYAELCTLEQQQQEQLGQSRLLPTQQLPCESQLTQLDHMFTLAASLFSAYLLPAGLCLRFIGPRVCFLLGFFLVTLGSWGFATASSKYFIICYVLIGSGNPLLYIAAFNFGKLYPKSSNLLLSIFIGCFGFSSIVFDIFNVLHFDYGLSSQTIVTWFSYIPVILGLIGIMVVPPDPYHVQRAKKHQIGPTVIAAGGGEEEPHETTPFLTTTTTTTTVMTTTNTDRHEDGDKEMQTPAVEYQPLKERSIAQQLITPQFMTQALFFCWGMLHQNFYLGTIGDQIYRIAGDDEDRRETAARILTKFSILYPLGCILAILPVGTLVRNYSVGISLYVYCTATVMFSILSILPSVTVQWATSTLYVLVRVGFFTIMSTYSSTIFGFQNLGTLFGCAGSLAGMVSLLGTLLSDRALHVDHSFLPINSVLLMGAIINFAFPTVILYQKWQTE